MLEQRAGIGYHLRIQRLRHLIATLKRAVARERAGIGLGEQRVQVEIVQNIRAAADLMQQIGPPDHVR